MEYPKNRKCYDFEYEDNKQVKGLYDYTDGDAQSHNNLDASFIMVTARRPPPVPWAGDTKEE